MKVIVALLIISAAQGIRIRTGIDAGKASSAAASEAVLTQGAPTNAKQTRAMPKPGDCTDTGGIEVVIKSLANPPPMDNNWFSADSSDVAVAFRCGLPAKGSVVTAQTETIDNVQETATAVFTEGTFCFPGTDYDQGVLASEGCKFDVWDDDSSFLNIKIFLKRISFSNSHWSGHDHIGGFTAYKAMTSSKIGSSGKTVLNFSVKEVLSPATKKARADEKAAEEAKVAKDKADKAADLAKKRALKEKADAESLKKQVAAEKDAAKKAKLEALAKAAAAEAIKRKAESDAAATKAANDKAAADTAAAVKAAADKAAAAKLVADKAAAEQAAAVLEEEERLAKEKEKKEAAAMKKKEEEDAEAQAKLPEDDKKKCCLQIGFKEGYKADKCRSITATEVDSSCCVKEADRSKPQQEACENSAKAAHANRCTQNSRKKAKKGSAKWCKCNTDGKQIGGANGADPTGPERCIDVGGGRKDVCQWNSGDMLCVPSKATAGGAKKKAEEQAPVAPTELVDDDKTSYGDEFDPKGNCEKLRAKDKAGQRKRCARKAGEHCKKTCAAAMANKSQSQVQSDSAKPEGQTVVQRMAANIDQGNGKKNKELSKELRLSKQQAVLK